jgi:hypothetical protein
MDFVGAEIASRVHPGTRLQPDHFESRPRQGQHRNPTRRAQANHGNVNGL